MCYNMLKTFAVIWTLMLAQANMAYGQIPGFFMDEDRNKVEMSFLDNNNLIIVPVSINGSPSLNFLIDTGVKSNLLFSKTLGDQLDLFYTRKLNLMGADGKAVISASISPNNELKLKGVTGKLQSLLVLEEDYIALEKVVGIPIHGVIGHEFFKLNAVRVNYTDKILTFYKPEGLKRKPLGYKRLKMRLEDGKPYIQSVILQKNGPTLQAKLLIDTGANHGLLLNQETSDNIVTPSRILETSLGTSLGGDLEGFVGRVPKIHIGRLTFRNVITSYPEETQFSDIIVATGRFGSLGSDILSRGVFIYDYPRERIFYRRGPNFKDPFEFDMSGLALIIRWADGKKLYVNELRKDSPAEKAGIREGDQILSVNNIPVEFWELTEVNELLRSREGRKVKIEVQRLVRESTLVIQKTIELKRQI